jgi:hypothetical protein
VAEEAGHISERFQWLAKEHADRTEHALIRLGRVVSLAIRLIVMLVIIYFIFLIFGKFIGGINRELDM